MSTITLQFDNYNDMIRFCKTVTKNCACTPKDDSDPITHTYIPPTNLPDHQNKSNQINVDYTQLDELSNDINSFVDDVEQYLEPQIDDPQFAHMGKYQKAIVKLFWHLKIFSTEMVMFKMPNKTANGSYINYYNIIKTMVEKNLLIQIDDNHYFVNPKVIDQKPKWLSLDVE